MPATREVSEMVMTASELRSQIERRRCVHWWGQRRFIKPAFVEHQFGDGKVLLAIAPMMFRPNHFVIRIDSSWSTSNWESEGKVSTDDWLELVYDAIEEEYPELPWGKYYGCKWDEDGDGDLSSRTGCAFNDGSAWWEIDYPA